jgi:hypothetical protein
MEMRQAKVKNSNCDKVLFSGHAIQRMFERSICKEDILRVIAEGEVIDEYPGDHPYPSMLILGRIDKNVIHAVIARDEINKETIIVTTYIPDPRIWSSDYRTRRKS